MEWQTGFLTHSYDEPGATFEYSNPDDPKHWRRDEFDSLQEALHMLGTTKWEYIQTLVTQYTHFEVGKACYIATHFRVVFKRTLEN